MYSATLPQQTGWRKLAQSGKPEQKELKDGYKRVKKGTHQLNIKDIIDDFAQQKVREHPFCFCFGLGAHSCATTVFICVLHCCLVEFHLLLCSHRYFFLSLLKLPSHCIIYESEAENVFVFYQLDFLVSWWLVIKQINAQTYIVSSAHELAT